MKTVQFLGEDCIFFFHGFREHKNTPPAKQTNKHAQRTVDRNRHNHPFLWFDSEPFRRTILNRAQHSQTTASPELKSGFERTLLKCSKEIWVPHAFWPAGAQRKTLVREGRNLCAINCLSLKKLLNFNSGVSFYQIQGQQRDEEAGLMWLNLKSRIQIRIALVIRTGRQKFRLLFKLYSNCIFINATLIKLTPPPALLTFRWDMSPL